MITNKLQPLIIIIFDKKIDYYLAKECNFKKNWKRFAMKN